MGINTKNRSTTFELMDDFSLVGEELRLALDKIAKINQFLGGNKLTLNGLKPFLSTMGEIKIVDVGCGNGDMLRNIADYGNKNQLNLKLIGIDANGFTINYAKKLSANYSNISYECLDVFSEVFSEVKYDILLCTLTLHHFNNNEIDYLITLFYKNAKKSVIINDLHRSKISYHLFKLVCFTFRLNAMSKNDGLISILRGFKKEELIIFSKKNDIKNYAIQWKWAFRYQWILTK